MATTAIDEEGNNVGTTPTIYAGQPPYKLLFKLAYTGSDLASAFTVGGTLGGNAATYCQVVKPSDNPTLYGPNFSATEFWVIASPGGRIADNASGSITVNGPSGLTTFTPTIVSSQGRPTTIVDAVSRFGNGVFALITTECWLRFKLAKDRSDALFAGVPRSATFDQTLTVTSPGQLKTTLSGLTTGSGQKYLILCRQVSGESPSAWASSGLTTSGTKDFTVGGGYCVIAPDPAAPAQVRNRWFFNTKHVGLEIRDFDMFGDKLTVDGGTNSVNGTLFLNALDNEITMRGLNFVDPYWSQDVAATDSSNSRIHLTIDSAKCARVIECKFKGGLRGVVSLDSWFTEIVSHDSGQSRDDWADPSMSCKNKGHWADENYIFWMHDGRLCNLLDIVTGSHLDNCQNSTALSYPVFNSPRTSNYPATSIAQDSYRIINNGTEANLWQATTGGTTAAHTLQTDLPGAAQSPWTDGSVVWTWVCTRENAPRHIVVLHSNAVVSGGSVGFDNSSGTPHREHPGAQFIINSNERCPFPFAIFNNHGCMTQQRGVHMEAATQVERNFVEFNSFLGPHEHPASHLGFPTDYLDQQIKSLGPTGKLRAYRNFAGGFDASVFQEGNIRLKGKSPGVGQAYWENCAGLSSDFFDLTDPNTGLGDQVWRFNLQDDQLDNIEDTLSALSKLFHSTVGLRVGARHKELWPISFKVVDSLGVESAVMSQTVAMMP